MHRSPALQSPRSGQNHQPDENGIPTAEFAASAVFRQASHRMGVRVLHPAATASSASLRSRGARGKGHSGPKYLTKGTASLTFILAAGAREFLLQDRRRS